MEIAKIKAEVRGTDEIVFKIVGIRGAGFEGIVFGG